MHYKGLHALRDRQILFMNQGDRPHGMLRKRNPAETVLSHIVKDEIHGGRICLTFQAELIAEAESAGVEIGIDGDSFPGCSIKKQMMDQKMVIFQNQRLGKNLPNRDFLSVIEAAPRMNDEVNFLESKTICSPG
jgi:hypothetical protein